MTEQRPLQPTPVGALRFNTDTTLLEYFDGNQYVNITIDSPERHTGGTRGMIASGINPSVWTGTYEASEVIQFINVETTGDSIDFGDAMNITATMSGCSSPTRGIFGSGRITSPATLWMSRVE